MRDVSRAWRAAVAAAAMVAGVAGPALAQEAGAAPAAAEAGGAEKYALLTTMGAWQVSCPYGKDGKRAGCVGSLRVIEPAAEGGQGGQGRVVMEWTIAKNAEGALESRFSTLTGVMLAPGVRLKLPGSEARKLDFVACGPQACVALAPMDEAFVRAAGKVDTVEAALVGADGRTYTYAFQPEGIDRVIRLVR